MTQRIEAIVETAAAAILAAAVGFASLRFGSPVAASAAATAVSLVMGVLLLRSVGPGPTMFRIEPFEARALPDPIEPDELLLTDMIELVLTEADRFVPVPAVGGDEILALDDVLASVARDSRVVRLFDPAAMPTPGELRQQIDRHLGGAASASANASQALHDALAELRRSLR